MKHPGYGTPEENEAEAARARALARAAHVKARAARATGLFDLFKPKPKLTKAEAKAVRAEA